MNDQWGVTVMVIIIQCHGCCCVLLICQSNSSSPFLFSIFLGRPFAYQELNSLFACHTDSYASVVLEILYFEVQFDWEPGLLSPRNIITQSTSQLSKLPVL
jgi:hypothetical protein